MTTSQETDWMNHPVIRALVDQAATLALEERITLVKGLIPGIADALSEEEYEQFVTFIRLKGERFLEAKAHPGEGRAERHIPGERDLEGRAESTFTSPNLGREHAMASWTGWVLMAGLLGLAACGGDQQACSRRGRRPGRAAGRAMAERVAQYTPVRLTADLSRLSDHERRMLPLLIDAAAAIDTMYWQQYYPALDSLLASLHGLAHPPVRRDQLRPVGPARQRRAVRRRRRRAAARRGVLPSRRHQGRVRAAATAEAAARHARVHRGPAGTRGPL